MFKKDVAPGAKTKLKSSIQRGVRNKVCETYPLLAPHIDAIIPKKAQLDVVKIPDARVTLYSLEGTGPLFFQHMDDALIPHLSVIHRFPDHFPRVRVDRGAIRFVLSGAALMVPGLTSPGGRLPHGLSASTPTSGGAEEAGERPEGAAPAGLPLGEGLGTGDDKRYYEQPDLPAGCVVVVEAEGKESACSVGQLKMGTKEMRAAKKGIGIENGHYVGDGLWKMGMA